MAYIQYTLQDLGTYPYKSFRCTLDGQVYELTWQWNDRCQFWTCAVGFVGSDPLIIYKVTSFSDPLQIYGYNTDLPQGRLLVMSFIQPDNRVTQESVGENNIHNFIYLSDEK